MNIFKNNGIISNPNCSTSQLMLALEPINNYEIVVLDNFSNSKPSAIENIKKINIKI